MNIEINILDPQKIIDSKKQYEDNQKSKKELFLKNANERIESYIERYFNEWLNACVENMQKQHDTYGWCKCKIPLTILWTTKNEYWNYTRETVEILENTVNNVVDFFNGSTKKNNPYYELKIDKTDFGHPGRFDWVADINIGDRILYVDTKWHNTKVYENFENINAYYWFRITLKVINN